MDEYFGNVNTTIVYKEVVNTTVVDKKVLNKTITHKEIVNETVVHMAASAETIVKQAFNSSFGHLVNKCDKARDFDQCCRNVRQGPLLVSDHGERCTDATRHGVVARPKGSSRHVQRRRASNVCH
jgi:prophage DNA circulation protein